MTFRTDEDQNWFYVNEGRRQGPLDRRGLVLALLAQDAPEKTLVWRSGLNAWTKAGELQELRIELPPPIPKEGDPSDPTAPPPLPTEDQTLVAIGAPEGEAGGTDEDDEEDELESSPTGGSGSSPDAAEGWRRRRRRKRKHSETTSHTPRVLELLALFLVLALVLWFLLRRMNRVPEGTIINQGQLRLTPGAPGPKPLSARYGTIPEAAPGSSASRL